MLKKGANSAQENRFYFVRVFCIIRGFAGHDLFVPERVSDAFVRELCRVCNQTASQFRGQASKIWTKNMLGFGCYESGFHRGEIVIVTFGKNLPLDERLLRIDHIQARRYSKLTGVAEQIATEGIVRHLRACDRMDVNPDTSAVREIIDDAINGRRVFAESTERSRAA